MRWIEPGTFLMGSPEDEPGRLDSEGPQHPVMIGQGFWLFDTVCTGALWRSVMDDRFWSMGKYPIASVSWIECQNFLKRLNKLLPGLDLSLPSEAQWEYACRAGTTGLFSYGANITSKQVNYNATYPYQLELVPVASLPANPWGLYEMHGNVWEFCQDRWHFNYKGAPTDGSAWEDTGTDERRVVRGGCWIDRWNGVRSAYRYRVPPDFYRDDFSFRCARVQEGAEPATKTLQGPPGGATNAEPTLLRLDAGESPVRCALPQAPAFLIRTDREHLTFRRIIKPAWANAIGRDRFGLWCEIEIDPGRGEPVVQRLRWIPPGRFWMGSPEEEQGRWENESPHHPVTLTEGYWLFDTPCTQALWEAAMGNNPSRFQSSTRPVENVRWYDVQDFLARLNARIPGLDLMLPSEAQWEHACRAGTETAIYTGALDILGENNAPALDPIAWYGGNSGVDFELDNGYHSSDWKEKQYPHTKAGTRPVKLKRANLWGLYDVLGNVWEWTQDHWHDDYRGAPTDGSAWISSDTGAYRVLRGGSWFSDARLVRAAYRLHDRPSIRSINFGFRCARFGS